MDTLGTKWIHNFPFKFYGLGPPFLTFTNVGAVYPIYLFGSLRSFGPPRIGETYLISSLSDSVLI